MDQQAEEENLEIKNKNKSARKWKVIRILLECYLRITKLKKEWVKI